MQTGTTGGALGPLFSAVREAAGEAMWGAAVKLARTGAVVGVSDDGEEVQLRVKAPGKPVPHEVFLWPDDVDWGCDCGRNEVCVHVVAAAIALQRSRTEGEDLPAPSRAYQVRVRYALRTQGQALSLTRELLWPDGKVTPLEGALAQENVVVSREDAQAESLLAVHPGGALSAELLRRLLVILEGRAEATLDGAPIHLSPEPVVFVVKVTDAGEGFRVGLYRPPGIDALFRGAARVGDALHPTSHGDLTPDQRRMLVRGVEFGPTEVGPLVGEYLPKLEQRIPVEIATDRLPRHDALVPRVALHLTERAHGLEVRPEVVYGDPPVARITPGGALQPITDAVVPARDLSAERIAVRAFEGRMGERVLRVGYRQVLGPAEAAAFLQFQLPKHDGPVFGKVSPDRFRVVTEEVRPSIDVQRVPGRAARRGQEAELSEWALSVRFGTESGGEADPLTVLEAWRNGRSLVPLLDGGWAPLPTDWLREHGALLRELLEARDEAGRVDRNATAALVELLEDTEGQVPTELRRLRAFLEGDEGLPELEIPEGFVADLRPYQVVGFRWLGFLREMGLNGILADDMGLGKTVQALAALASVPGPHLVVAPTSVLRNWELEAARFAPGLSVNVYHGPHRKLDDSDITLTSYTLLRMDLAALLERQWTYVVLDEAQAIKNAQSQTARSAIKLRSSYRLCLTGTPVENRLEELWSLFRFLMPGLLGSQQAFRDRFVKPVEVGDPKARGALRARVRPYVLRRLKQQVAAELPPLTDVVIRCEMSPEQRRVYDAVRLMARRDVQDALVEGAASRNTMLVLEALLRMRQACCDPSLLPGDAGQGAGSAKLDRMEELLVELVCDDHKALVFSQWTSLLDRAQVRLQKLGIPYVRLDGSTRDRQAVIDTFQSPDGPPVFLLSLKAGGTGLNLTEADYVLHLDPWWNPAVERQATDRAHRIGQDKPVVSCRLIAEDSVEERILELQDAKRDLADAALGTEGGFLRSLTADELRSLFEG